MNAGRSRRSCGRYPHTHISEKTARSAPRSLAFSAKLRIRAEFPGKSPTVGLNCARAIFMRCPLAYGRLDGIAIHGLAASAFQGRPSWGLRRFLRQKARLPLPGIQLAVENDF